MGSPAVAQDALERPLALGHSLQVSSVVWSGQDVLDCVESLAQVAPALSLTEFLLDFFLPLFD